MKEFKGHAVLQKLTGVFERSQSFKGCLVGVVYFLLFPFLVSDGVCKSAGTMVIKIGIEMILIKFIYPRGVFLRNVSVAHVFADDSPILSFSQSVIIAMARA